MHRIIETRELPMKLKRWSLPFVAAVCLGSASTALAQADMERSIDQYSCKDVMRESGGQRDVAIAFLHGYLLGKSGAAKFNLNALRAQTDQFVELCLDKSSAKAVDVMSSIKK